MAQSTFARSEEGNIQLLNEKLKREAWNRLFFSRFVGFTTEDDQGSKIPSGAPIEVINRFTEEGSDSLKMALLKRLTGAGVSGDNQLKGNEERQNVYYQNVYINQHRHAVKSGGAMSQQRMKKFNLAAKYRPQLSDWWAQYMEVDIWYTFLHGYSRHIMATTANGGYNITSGQKICHPNFYAAGDGFATWNATPATYEGTVENSVTGVTDTSTDHFTTSLLETLRVEVQDKHLAPVITEDGFEFYPMLVNSRQMKQIRSDSTWAAAQRDANNMKGLKNPIFNGSCGHYAGFVLYERNFTPSVDPNAGAGTVEFGYPTAQFGLSALSDHARKVGLIFGAQALAMGVAKYPFFVEDDEDFENLRAVSAGQIWGSARAEHKDNSTDGSNTDVINQSSIAFVTHSA